MLFIHLSAERFHYNTFINFIFSKFSFNIFQKPIVIGNSCWIATDVFIAPGVTITDEVVIGARSIVFKDILENGIYKGNPAKKNS